MKVAWLVSAAFMVASANAAMPPKREWRAVPGHKNILVDMTSIEPMRKVKTGPTTGSPDSPLMEFEETSARIRLNGHIFDYYLLTCSGFTQNQPATVYFPENRLNTPPSKVMGYVPAGVIEGLVCPVARAAAQAPTHNN